MAQEGLLTSKTFIPSQSWVPFHWDKSSLPPKIRLASEDSANKSPCHWSRGTLTLDKIGITALRLPSTINKKPMVVQAEVRLATKKQDSAVVIVIWSSIEKSNPLYMLKNNSNHTIFCCQPLANEHYDETTSEKERKEPHQSPGALRRITMQKLKQEHSVFFITVCIKVKHYQVRRGNTLIGKKS